MVSSLQGRTAQLWTVTPECRGEPLKCLLWLQKLLQEIDSYIIGLTDFVSYLLVFLAAFFALLLTCFLLFALSPQTCHIKRYHQTQKIEYCKTHRRRKKAQGQTTEPFNIIPRFRTPSIRNICIYALFLSHKRAAVCHLYT